MKRSAVMTVVAGILFAGLVGAEGAAAASRTSVAALPGPAQAAVAGALGRDSADYRVREADGRLRLANRGHEFDAGFDAGGVRVRSGGAAIGLSLAALGRGTALRAVVAGTRRAGANRVEYRRPGVTEWYVNGPLGLEHGFTLLRRPAAVAAAGRGAVTLALDLAGDLSPRLDADRRGLALIDRAGRERLAYRGLWATDADGRELRAWLALARGRLLVRVDDAGARYPLTIDPYFQGGKLTASDAAASDFLGTSVAIDGDVMVVGAPRDDVGANDQGSAYVFVKPASGWADATETAKLTASDAALGDNFGTSVAIGDAISRWRAERWRRGVSGSGLDLRVRQAARGLDDDE